jgi:hypothetical protein
MDVQDPFGVDHEAIDYDFGLDHECGVDSYIGVFVRFRVRLQQGAQIILIPDRIFAVFDSELDVMRRNEVR